MSHTLRCRAFFGTPDSQRVNAPFAQDTGFALEHGETVFIEVIHAPMILGRLQAAGYFADGDAPEWDILYISWQGVLLLLGDSYTAGRRVFLPWSNIIALHTVDGDFLGSLREDTGAERANLERLAQERSLAGRAGVEVPGG